MSESTAETRYKQERRENLIILLQNERPPMWREGEWCSIAKAVSLIALDAGLDVVSWDPSGTTVPKYVDLDERAFLVSVLRGTALYGQWSLLWWQDAEKLASLLRDAGVDVSAASELLARHREGEARDAAR